MNQETFSTHAHRDSSLAKYMEAFINWYFQCTSRMPSWKLDLEDTPAKNTTWLFLLIISHMIDSVINSCELLYTLVIHPFYTTGDTEVTDASVAVSSFVSASLFILYPFFSLTKHSSVQFSHSVVCDSLRPHELQHARPPCPSPTPRVSPNSCPSSQWCHPAILSPVVPFSSCPQSLQASGSFPMSQFFTWGGQSIGVWASVSVLPMNTQDWSLEWTGWISLQSKELSRVFSNTTVQKHQFFGAQLSSQSNSHIHTWPLGKP